MVDNRWVMGKMNPDKETDYVLYNNDCLYVMPLIADKSVDMILADLPYGTTACKWDTIIPFEPLWEQYKRIIKDNGAIVLTASQPFTSMLVMSNLDWFRYEIIWEKDRGTNFLQATYQPLKLHENIIIFYKNTPIYNPQKEILKSKNSLSRATRAINDIKRLQGGQYILEGKQKHNLDKFKLPESIIYFKREIGNNQFKKEKIFHPTQKPVALFEYLIKTYTNEGDLVLDNCAGSGTTGVACKNLGRNYILIEKEEKYCEIARNRIKTIPESLFYKKGVNK